MYANRVVVEVIRKTGKAYTHTREYAIPRTLVEIQTDLWAKVGRMPVMAILSGGCARVTFQEGRRVTDTLDSLENLVRNSIKSLNYLN